MRKLALATFTIGTIALTMCSSVFADDTFQPGVTVTADENSPTGYTATFVYNNPNAEEVTLLGGFSFFTDDGSRGWYPEEYTAPYDWNPELFPAGDLWYKEEMKKDDEGTFTLSFPLPSGHYMYQFSLDGGTTAFQDPANPTLDDPLGVSLFDVPYDEEKQEGTFDYTFLMEDENVPAGDVSYIHYKDYAGKTRPLGVYLPADYDADREEPYKVLYLAHGGGGSERNWFAIGNTNIMLDNDIAAGNISPFIVVTMNNAIYNWDYDVINQNLMENIIPFIENRYNVSTEAEDRAFAGLSMGGMTTSNVYYRNADKFGYFGIFSGADASVDMNSLDIDKLKQPKLFIGVGIYDVAYTNESYGTETDRTISGFKDHLDELGIEYGYYETKAAHDWFTWEQLIKVFVDEYLWK